MEASQSQSKDIVVGFRSLTLCCPNNDQKMHHNSCIMASNLMSPPPSPPLSHIGDYIGMESCVDMKSGEDMHMMNVNATTTMTTSYHEVCSKKRETWRKRTREFPPPITLLARTENLSSHMAFVLKRYYTNDGRLILREERVRHHEYFRAHRSNGHLTLQLVPLNDDDDELVFPPPYENGNEQSEANVVEEKIEEFVTPTPESSCNDNEGIEIGGGGGEISLKYNNVVISSSYYFGVQPVPAIKPVHT